jgi:hypothetical protein
MPLRDSGSRFALLGPNPSFFTGFRLFRLDSELAATISLLIRRGFFAPFVFARIKMGQTLVARKSYPPRLKKKPTRAHPEAGIEHEGK